MRIVGVDPSSKRTGVALVDTARPTPAGPAILGQWGITGSPSARRLAALPVCEAQRAALTPAGMTAYRRLLDILGDLGGVMDEIRATGPIDLTVVELPSGRPGTGSKRGGRSSLTVYGAAAGMVYGYLMGEDAGGLVGITEQVWTAGRGSKEKRQAGLAYARPREYDPALDKGGDIADAIGIACWAAGQDWAKAAK